MLKVLLIFLTEFCKICLIFVEFLLNLAQFCPNFFGISPKYSIFLKVSEKCCKIAIFRCKGMYVSAPGDPSPPSTSNFIPELPRLRMLFLADNCIRRIENLGALTDLRTLDLAGNYLKVGDYQSRLVRWNVSQITPNWRTPFSAQSKVRTQQRKIFERKLDEHRCLAFVYVHFHLLLKNLAIPAAGGSIEDEGIFMYFQK